MIYLVTGSPQLFNKFTVVSVQESLSILAPLKVVGLDTETSGLSFLDNKLLTLQLGNKHIQVVIDCTTVDVKQYKEYLESNRLFIAHNFKFDYKWLLKEGIVIRNTYDTFIAEKVLNLGLYYIKCDLKTVAKKYVGVDLDKSIRGDIIRYGITDDVIIYAASDVLYLEEIREKQLKIAKDNNQVNAVLLECAFTPALAYIEYCGIRLNVDKWRYKISLDEVELCKAEQELNDWVVEYCKSTNNLPLDIWDKGKNTKYPDNVYAVQPQPSLFAECEEGPKCILNWGSSTQIIPLFRELGYNLEVKDKKTGKIKESAGVANLKIQKDPHGIVKLFSNRSKAFTRIKSFGQNFIDAISSKTGRIHVEFNQLINSSRMSCGKGNSTSDEVDDGDSVNIQQLPNDHLTRECFIPNEGNLLIFSDYSDQEGKVMANFSKDREWLSFYNSEIPRDGHSFVAKMLFKDELEDIAEEDVKTKRPDLRQKAKAPRFTFAYRGTPKALHQNTGLPTEECEKMFESYFSVFTGFKKYFEEQEIKTWNSGYVLINEWSGMRSYIPYYNSLKWIEANKNNIDGIWDLYKEGKQRFLDEVDWFTVTKKENNRRNKVGLPKIKIPDTDEIVDQVKVKGLVGVYDKYSIPLSDTAFFLLKSLFTTKSSYANKSANMPTQGSSAHMTKTAIIRYFKSIIERGLVFKCLIVNAIHDEIGIEVPKDIAEEEAKLLKKCMEDASSYFCTHVKIGAVPEIGKYWIH